MFFIVASLNLLKTWKKEFLEGQKSGNLGKSKVYLVYI